MKRALFAITLLFSLAIHANESKDYVKYVNPLMGTMSSFELSAGNTYPATAMPWGMNFWTPRTAKMGDGWQYTYTANKIYGFEQTHQPSPWINDYGEFTIMPMSGKPVVDEAERASWFSHKGEVSMPHYYKVYLADYDIVTELTPTERAAMFRFTFPAGESFVAIDAHNNGSHIEIIPQENKIIGYSTRNSGGVPDNFRNWFVLKFDKDIEGWTLYDGADNPIPAADELEGNRIIASVSFKTVRGEKVGVKAASSFISLEQAWRNFAEVEALTFDQVKRAAKERWNEVLGRIEIGGGTTDQHRTFYSCLYRSLLFPRKFYEIDAEGKPVHYSPYNGQVCDGYLYTDTGFWDTFRALFPLLNLVYPSVNQEIQQGLANVARENEFLPEWASPGHRGCMVGNNSASVVADAILKGITPEEDWQTLYDCIVYGTEHVHPQVSFPGRLGHEYYNTLGYIPYNVGIHESVARTLEYAYNDWCILQLARKLGRPAAELEKWEARSDNWKNVFDPEHNLMRGRNADGSFQEPFSPYKWGGAFTEGNAWHYTWSVFHDVEGLMEAMGGREEFTAMLDSVFVVPPVYDDSYYGYRIHEITEMQVADMGNYAHGNQPAQHMIYLYDWAGEPRKAQKWVREVMDRLYSSAPDGYCGDEDNGQTSAWYVFSAMGFYPVCPASDQYAVGRPYFPRMKVHLENGRTLEINASNVNGADGSLGTYIKNFTVGGRRPSGNFLRYEDLMEGNALEFTMED